MAIVRFNVSGEDAAIIEKIVDRAIKAALEAGWMYDPVGARMDITACHRNGTPLKLAELLAADDFNFTHDVFGIRRHLDRTTGKLRDHFNPRFAKPEEHRGSRMPDHLPSVDPLFAHAVFNEFAPEEMEMVKEKAGGKR